MVTHLTIAGAALMKALSSMSDAITAAQSAAGWNADIDHLYEGIDRLAAGAASYEAGQQNTLAAQDTAAAQRFSQQAAAGISSGDGASPAERAAMRAQVSAAQARATAAQDLETSQQALRDAQSEQQAAEAAQQRAATLAALETTCQQLITSVTSLCNGVSSFCGAADAQDTGVGSVAQAVFYAEGSSGIFGMFNEAFAAVFGGKVTVTESALGAAEQHIADAYQADVNEFNTLINAARGGPLTSQQAAELYDIMQRNTWWFANVPPTAGGVVSPLTTEQARLAFWGLYSASSTDGSNDYYSRSLGLINRWMTQTAPGISDPTDPDYQAWVQSQANLAGFMNCAPNFDTEQQVTTLSDYADSQASVGHTATFAVGLVAVSKDAMDMAAAVHPNWWRPRAPNGRFMPLEPLQVPTFGHIVDYDKGGAAAVNAGTGGAGVSGLPDVSPSGMANAYIDTGMDIMKADWRSQAHYDEQFGLDSVVEEVNRATIQDLINKQAVSMPSGWQSWGVDQWLNWAQNSAPPSVGNLILDLDYRVAGNNGNHH
jgi:hypothetical protein